MFKCRLPLRKRTIAPPPRSRKRFLMDPLILNPVAVAFRLWARTGADSALALGAAPRRRHCASGATARGSGDANESAPPRNVVTAVASARRNMGESGDCVVEEVAY